MKHGKIMIVNYIASHYLTLCAWHQLYCLPAAPQTANFQINIVIRITDVWNVVERDW